MTDDPQSRVVRLERDCRRLADEAEPHAATQAAELFRDQWPQMFPGPGTAIGYRGGPCGLWREKLTFVLGKERVSLLDDVCRAVVGVLDAAGERGVRRAVNAMNDAAADFVNLPLPPEDDDENFVLASRLWKERFESYKEFKTWLDSTPEHIVRRRKPSSQRLEIHAGDWHSYWAMVDRHGKGVTLSAEQIEEMHEGLEQERDAARTELRAQKGLPPKKWKK